MDSNLPPSEQSSDSSPSSAVAPSVLQVPSSHESSLLSPRTARSPSSSGQHTSRRHATFRESGAGAGNGCRRYGSLVNPRAFGWVRTRRRRWPPPPSLSANDIRAAASAAAEARLVRSTESGGQDAGSEGGNQGEGWSRSGGEVATTEKSEEFIDEDELLNMPSLLDDMARGMQVSPPRMKSPNASDDSPPNSDHGDSLWSF
ncbi:hypothetical protein K1719_047253 [Acacia pycnantha]|nr:hypothetical protein K1719_047253 [Acacia pycnantha]